MVKLSTETAGPRRLSKEITGPPLCTPSPTSSVQSVVADVPHFWVIVTSKLSPLYLAPKFGSTVRRNAGNGLFEAVPKRCQPVCSVKTCQVLSPSGAAVVLDDP